MILVDISVPAINCKYDFKLDENAFIVDVADELGGILSSIAGGSAKTEDLLLCDCERNMILPLDSTLKQCNVGNGSRLMVI